MTTVFDYERLLSRVEVIIFTQPNSSDLGSFLQPRYVNLPQLAEIFEMDVYGFDYSGYGYSTGIISEKSIYTDIRAVYDYVRQTAPNKKIVLLGYSIGTTAVIDLASTHPESLAGVILVAPFTSGLRLLGNQPKREKTHFFDRFVSCDKVAAINVPVLICHGGRDTVVPSEHGLELYEKLQKPVTPLVVHGADHQSILNGAYPQTFCRIHRFLKAETEVNLTQEEAREGFVMF
ncbi:phospholipase/carboxylesterase [Ancylostoma ceylanicum]|uniref:Phospholipase/carboxylesterase n=1 Tax=Ancylostoma ceylanicum TaxID=53326 RepID=A0A0D6L5B9_9BILA|nr:phospholipase/carboxylesterase [Ancylostoma ceylanicum]